MENSHGYTNEEQKLADSGFEIEADRRRGERQATQDRSWSQSANMNLGGGDGAPLGGGLVQVIVGAIALGISLFPFLILIRIMPSILENLNKIMPLFITSRPSIHIWLILILSALSVMFIAGYYRILGRFISIPIFPLLLILMSCGSCLWIFVYFGNSSTY